MKILKRLDLWMQARCAQASLRWPVMGTNGNKVAKLTLILSLAFLTITIVLEWILK